MQFGIWKFDSDFGLIGNPQNLPEYFISTEKLWETQQTTSGEVWKWPIEMARNKWFSPSIANDFNRAFFYAQEFLESRRPEDKQKNLDFDARTVAIQTEILNDYFPGPEEEIPVLKKSLAK